MRVTVQRGGGTRHRGDRSADLVLAGLAGVALGFLAGRWLGGRGEPLAPAELGDPDESWADRWGERMDAAVEVGTRSFREMHRRWRGSPPLDVAAALETIQRVPHTEGVGLHDLGDGIVELVGEAPSEVAAEAVAALEQLPAVRFVVNRIWSRPGLVR